MDNAVSHSTTDLDLVKLATDIVSAYVGNNHIEQDALPQLIRSIHASLTDLSVPADPKSELRPAVPVESALTDEFIICLEDGKKFKSLKRHLRSKYDMSPEDYREKWGLPADYPMVAPGYSRKRSKLAKKMGLGKNDAT